MSRLRLRVAVEPIGDPLDGAACRDAHLTGDVFDDETLDSTQAKDLADRYCAGCPVKVGCAARAAGSRHTVGVWAGQWWIDGRPVSWAEMEDARARAKGARDLRDQQRRAG